MNNQRRLDLHNYLFCNSSPLYIEKKRTLFKITFEFNQDSDYYMNIFIARSTRFSSGNYQILKFSWVPGSPNLEKGASPRHLRCSPELFKNCIFVILFYARGRFRFAQFHSKYYKFFPGIPRTPISEICIREFFEKHPNRSPAL